MAERHEPGRLDAATLAAYVEGRLPPEDRARVDAEIARDPETHEWVVNALRVRDELAALEEEVGDDPQVGIPDPAADSVAVTDATPLPGPTPAPHPVPPPVSTTVVPFHRRRAFRAGMGAVLATAAALVLMVRVEPGLWQRWMGGGDVDPRFAKLVEAVGEERYIEARLTGGFKYGPLRSVTRGPGDLSNQNLTLLAAAGELQKQAQADPSAENLHAWGVAQVLLGDHDAAIRTLRDAEALAPGRAAILADLSAAWLARREPEDVARALDAAERAIAAGNTPATAHYNRALALEALGLVTRAAEAWEEVRRLSPQTPWADEAARRIERLSRPPVSSAWPGVKEQLLRGVDRDLDDVAARFPDRLTTFAEGELLQRWARAPDDDGSATFALDLSARAGFAIARVAGDHLTATVFDTIARRCRASESTCRDLRTATVAYLDAAADFDAERHQAAAAALARADTLLSATGHPLAAWAIVLEAHARYGLGDLDRALSLAARAERAAGLTDLRLRGRIAWVRGLVAVSRGDYGEARRQYEQHIALTERAPSAEQRKMARLLLVALLRYLGEDREAWRLRLDVAAMTPEDDESPRLHYLFMTSLVAACHAADLHHAALALADDLVQSAVAFHPGAEVEALAMRVRIRGRLGPAAAIDDDVVAVGEAIARIPDEAVRRRVRVQALEAEVEARLEGDPVRALAAATEAIDIIQSRGDTLRRARLHHAVSVALRRRGDHGGADAAAREGLAALRHELGTLGADERVSYFDRAWDLVGEELRVAAETRDWGRAVAALEIGAARPGVPDAAPEDLAARIQSRLGAADLLLVLTQFGDRLDLLAIRTARIEAVTIPVTRVEAANWLASDRPLADRARRAGPRLMPALRPLLAGVTRVVVVASEPWHDLPFAALRERPEGRPLVDEVSILVAPSLSAALRPEPRLPREPAALVIDAATVAGPGLPALPGARAESAAVVRLYPRAIRLSGEESSPAAVIRALPSAAVVHVAAHGVAHPERPGLSRLVLGGGDRDVLFASDLSALDLSDVQVVVLAACRTAAGASRRGQGVLSLARAFVDAGARAVIASQADLPDGAVSAVMVSVHEHLRRGLPPHQALRQAQRDALARGDDEATWAPLVVVGGIGALVTS